VQDRATEGELKVEWVPTEANLADFFTKKLPRARFIELRDSIMNCRDQVVANVLRCNDEPFIEFPEPYTPYPNYNEDAWMGGQPISFLLSESEDEDMVPVNVARVLDVNEGASDPDGENEEVPEAPSQAPVPNAIPTPAVSAQPFSITTPAPLPRAAPLSPFSVVAPAPLPRATAPTPVSLHTPAGSIHDEKVGASRSKVR